jgi:hypothetical protein
VATFLVEQYVPGLDRASACAISDQIAAACAALLEGGVCVRFERTIILPGEETALCFVEADSSDDVRRAIDSAGMTSSHIQVAMAVGPC